MTDDKKAARADPVAFMTKNGFDFTGLPESLRAGYAIWWCFGIPAGSFLQAVIEGDLYESYGSVYHINQGRLPELLQWFSDHADSRSIRKNAASWADGGGYFGRMLDGTRMSQ